MATLEMIEETTANTTEKATPNAFEFYVPPQRAVAAKSVSSEESPEPVPADSADIGSALDSNGREVGRIVNFRSAVETITPAIAAQYLATNPGWQRNVSIPDLERYARDMANRDWRETGEPISFTPDNILIDGQQRLYACVLADTPFRTVVQHGIPAENYPYMNVGKVRHVSQMIMLSKTELVITPGIRGPLFSALRSLFRFLLENHAIMCNFVSVSKHVKLSMPALDRLLRHYPLMVQAADDVCNAITGQHPLIGHRGIISFMQFFVLMSRPDLAAEFVSKMSSGVGLTDGCPILVIRNKLITASREHGGLKKTIALEKTVLRGLNYFLEGKTLGNLYTRTNDVYHPVTGFTPVAAK